MDIPPPPGPAPYQRWPGPHSPYSRPPVNGFAIASLVLGLLCFLPGVGLVLGLIALAQIKRKGERGKGMAVAGSILSVLAVVAGGARDFMDGFREAARASRQDTGAFPVDEGGCLNAPEGRLDSMKFGYQVDEVPCAGPHDAEVFASYRVHHATYPGDGVLTGVAETKCADLQFAYVMDRWQDFGDADLYYFVPDRTTWRRGDRHVTCLFGAPDPDHPLKGTLRSDRTTLDADQLAYVTAEQSFERAYGKEPDAARVEDDLPGHKEWAAGVVKGLDERVRLLRAHDWPAGTRKRVDALVAAIGKGRTEWRKAAEATDADSYIDHYEAALAGIGDEQAVAVRKSLGLATTSPREAAPGDGAGSGPDGDHDVTSAV
ncbi:DUF4190 domain-containing protein [Streptomyces sp. NPDC005863]|uniref:DUF4190 domain-containing protein n=1 Tax=unclassified Streptomyces TaxID=2593676 RepID=UPI0033D57970